MSSAYWSQWDREELMSMQGIETDTYQDDDHDDSYQDDREKEEEKEGYCCNGCMDCLGMSWRDFM
jgi:hypothetical protein